MSTLSEYLALAKAHPMLFVNPPEAGFTILLDKNEIREVELQMARKLEATGLPTQWAQVGIVYQDQHIYILRDAVRFPDGSLGTYYRFVGGEDETSRVVILPFYQGRILLVRRFRYATRMWHFEIPIGLGKKSLSAEENARRELTEEIGATISLLISLGQIDPGPGISPNSAQLFYATIESYGNMDLDSGITELLLVTVTEFEQMIRDNHISDGFTIVTYTRAKLQGLL